MIEFLDIIMLVGWMLFYMVGVFVEFEWELICEWIRVGMVVVVKWGVKFGRYYVFIVDEEVEVLCFW